MNDPAHILVVDDDREIRTLLCDYLQKNGLRATGVPDGRALDRQLLRAAPDLIVLDLMLPGEDGFSICRRLRAGSQLPVIILTARDEDVDQILGFELGADDYVRKPFNPRALLARIRAVLRRTDLAVQGGPIPGAVAYRFGHWRLDTVTRALSRDDGAVVDLNGAEFGLLVLLLDARSRVVTRATLTSQLRGRDSEPYDRSIDVRISRLRQRLGDDARTPTLIKTVYGQGYALGVPVTAE
jgi:two-component system OmpR family response regulator